MCSQLRLSSYLSAQVLQESIIDPYRLVGNTGKLSEGHRGRMEPLHPKTGRFAQCVATYDVPAWASRCPYRVVFSSAASLIITVTDGEGEVIEREAGCATGSGPVAHDGGRSFCATATSAGLDGADLIRRC